MSLTKKLMARSPWLTDKVNYLILVFQILRKIGNKENFWKVPSTSVNYYNAYDDREQRMYFDGTRILCRDGRQNRWLTYPQAKERYIAPVVAEIEKLLLINKELKVLEVGCGNCINLVELNKRFNGKVQFFGTDVSPGRIEVAKKYFGARMAGISTKIESVTDPVPASELGAYDLVFSMHCLEQIPFAALQAVEGLWKRARTKVVFIEPVWEFARPVQRLKLVRSDYIRTLLPTIKYLGYDIVRAESLGFESSQKNQSSVIVIDK
jgi:SAM-dependent methyltransferase